MSLMLLQGGPHDGLVLLADGEGHPPGFAVLDGAYVARGAANRGRRCWLYEWVGPQRRGNEDASA